MESPTTRTTLGRILKKDTLPIFDVVCPKCGKLGLKAGSRNTRQGRMARLYCRTCAIHFSVAPLPRRRYSHRTILEAVTAYNLGRTLNETQAHVARRTRAVVPHNTIHSWIGQFAEVCTFTRFRKRYSFAEEEVLQTRTFNHNQEYKFKFHRLKANILCKTRFPQIRRYLWHIAEHCPNELFQNGGTRCSDGNLPQLSLRLMRKDTNAVPLAR